YYVHSITLFGVTLPQPFGYIIMVIFIVGVINSVNLMDGMDGLVSGFSLLIFIIIFGLAFADNNTVLMVLTASLAGSTLGFSKYNYYPAKVFLGDTGSLTLGFFLVLSSLLLPLKSGNGNLDLTFSLILFGLPVIDTFKVMIIRISHKRNPFLADRNHLHHIIFGNNINHRTTVFIIHSFTFLFVFTAIYYLKASGVIAGAAFILLALMLIFIRNVLDILRDSFMHKAYLLVRDGMPQFIFLFYKKFFVPLAIILLAVLFFFLIPGKSEIRHQVLLLGIIGTVVLFLIFLSQNFKSKLFNDVYVLINVAIFFSVTNLSHPLFTTLHLDYIVIKNTVLISLAILVLLLLIFLLVREKLFNMEVSFLTKYDFVLLALVSVVVILQDFIKYPQFYSISGKFIVGFVAYLVYKVITHFNKELSRWFLYLTFMVTFITFVMMYVD
ncbi:MAG: MraY family glycosyltransferase, partial [Ignavibacteriaceae bacterium]